MIKGDCKIGDKDVETLILTHKQERDSGVTFPYNIIIENDRQSIYYIGGNHSTDPANEQYPMINKYWDVFIRQEGKK